MKPPTKHVVHTSGPWRYDYRPTKMHSKFAKLFPRQNPSREKRGYGGPGRLVVACDRHGTCLDPVRGKLRELYGNPVGRDYYTRMGCPICRQEGRR